MSSAPMGPAYRRAALGRLAEEQFDVLVIGGGVVGAGVALDAVSRGRSVALVEARDWASGTSSRSSKLIHGGLRYLEQGRMGLVREALKERSLLVTALAPHLVRPVRFLLPLRHRVWQRAYYGAGLALYDVMGGARTVPRHRHLGRRRLAAVAAGLQVDAMVGAIEYHDAQVDDARFTLTVVRTAVEHGALAASGVLVERLLTGSHGEVVGAAVLDVESGTRLDVRARAVISATGVWTGELDPRPEAEAALQLRVSKGVHLVVARERIDLPAGLILRTERSVLFVIPWNEHWLIGTTDTDWTFDKADPAASGADIDYLLEQVNTVLKQPLEREDVEGVYVGLRPLVSHGPGHSAQLSREHSVATPVPGLTVVAGGKFTTYRVMAKDAVDVAARRLPGPTPAGVTDRLPLLGADGFAGLWHRRELLAERSGLPTERIEFLLGRYGWCARELLDLIAAEPDLGRPLTGAEEYLRVEVVYAVLAEDARHLDDVLTRRTRIFMQTGDRGAACADEVAELMARTLDWSRETLRAELVRYRAAQAASRDAERQPDDRSANAARLDGADRVATSILPASDLSASSGSSAT